MAVHQQCSIRANYRLRRKNAIEPHFGLSWKSRITEWRTTLVERRTLGGRKSSLHSALGHLGEAAVANHREDGSVVVEEVVCNREAFRSFVLTFLEGAEILGPPELRDDLIGWLEGMA